MSDLSFMHQLPGTIDLINRQYEEARRPRHHLGLSQAGHECKRYLWYVHRGYQGKDIEGRVLRLFQLGNLLEQAIIDDLISIGCTIKDQQKDVVFTQDGVRLVGHIDGIITGLVEAPKTDHLFEAKSCNDKKFKELKKIGCYEKWNPVYGFQIQAYCLGLGLKRAVAFIYNKNTSEMMMFRIRLRKEETIDKLSRVFEAITSQSHPERLCPREDHYLAKWCPYHDECFGIKAKTEQKGSW